MFTKFSKAMRVLKFRELRLGWWPCPICGKYLHVRLNKDEMGMRCASCGASPVTQSIVDVVRNECPDLVSMSVYEMSSRGSVVEWLRRMSGALTTSEYMDGVSPGTMREGVRCEDVQQLTFEDDVFDLCTSTEVFEHVEDDASGFSEVWRVLRPGGRFIFTVPLCDSLHTVERVRRIDGNLVNVLCAEFHYDPFARNGRVLCMRNYGKDILERLRHAGFSSAGMVQPGYAMMKFARKVIVAVK